MRLTDAIGYFVLGTILSGCSHIAIYTDSHLTSASQTGILYYPPKPYLLVSRTGAKDKPNDVQVVYLPDLTQPHYAVMTAGIGSSKLGLTFSNGVLVSANQESDPKITEAINALASVPGALASAAKTGAEASKIRAESSAYPKMAETLREVSDDMRDIIREAISVIPSVLNPSQITVLKRLPALLEEAAAALIAPEITVSTFDSVFAKLVDIKRSLSTIKPGADDMGEAGKLLWSRIRASEAKLDGTISELKPKPETPPTLSLYEVLMDANKGTTLREVSIGTLSVTGD